jgi:hypothetical protein
MLILFSCVRRAIYYHISVICLPFSCSLALGQSQISFIFISSPQFQVIPTSSFFSYSSVNFIGFQSILSTSTSSQSVSLSSSVDVSSSRLLVFLYSFILFPLVQKRGPVSIINGWGSSWVARTGRPSRAYGRVLFSFVYLLTSLQGLCVCHHLVLFLYNQSCPTSLRLSLLPPCLPSLSPLNTLLIHEVYSYTSHIYCLRFFHITSVLMSSQFHFTAICLRLYLL